VTIYVKILIKRYLGAMTMELSEIKRNIEHNADKLEQLRGSL